MLKGDLSSASLAQVLRSLADGGATGCVHLADPAGESARVWLRDGRVYAVLAPGSRPALGARLVCSGALAPEALAEAQEAQRTELQGWRLGELLVHLGYVDQPVVEAYVNEQVRDSLAELLPWGSGTWRFRVNERTREDVAAPIAVEDLLAEVSERRATWASLLDIVRGPEAVPVLSAAGTSDAELSIDADAWSLLCQVDGARSVVELARECGFTLYEAGRVVHGLVTAGLLDVEERTSGQEPASDRGEAEAAGERMLEARSVIEPVTEPVVELAPAAVAARLVSVLSGLGSVPADGTSPDVEPSAEVRGLARAVDDDVSGSVSRVSGQLDALLGPATAGDDLFSAPLHRPTTPVPAGPVDPAVAERARRDAVRRERDAEELAEAQAALEAVRAAEEQRREAEAAHAVAGVRAAEEAAAEEARAADEAAAAQVQAEAAEVERARLEEQDRIEQDRVEQDRAASLARSLAQAEQVRVEQEAAAVAAELAAMADAQPPATEDAATDARADAAAQAAAFAELSASASLEVPLPVPVAVAAPAASPSADEQPPMSYGHHDGADTAALLRELSSLGLDDDVASVPAARTAVTRPVSPSAQKKRKGLFGRG